MPMNTFITFTNAFKKRFLFRQYLIVYTKHTLSAGVNDRENQTEYEWLHEMQFEVVYHLRRCGPYGDLYDLTTLTISLE